MTTWFGTDQSLSSQTFETLKNDARDKMVVVKIHHELLLFFATDACKIKTMETVAKIG